MSEQNIAALTMPKWGMSMTMGKVVGWLEEEGTDIEQGDEILEIETEKTVNVMEASNAGKLVRIVAQVGDELPVGALLGVVAQADLAEEAIDDFITEFQKNFVPLNNDSAVDEGPSKVMLDGDITIAYSNLPAQAEGDAPPIIFIHGFGGDRKGWLFNSGDLSAYNEVYTLDLPGHGESSKEVGEGSLDFLAGTVARFMIAVNVSVAHIVGHSLGAAVAVSLAEKYSDRVASLTLIAGLGNRTEVSRDYIEGFLGAKRRKALKPYMQQLFANGDMVSRGMIEDVLKARRMEGAEDCLRKIANRAVLCKTGVSTEQNLLQLSMPVQVIWGRKDQVAPVSQVIDLPAALKVTVLEDAGHMVHMEAAKDVNHLISEFIAG
ncbi:Dihydrolipoamide acetyltransferase component (E2) of acetoin dehydrogenase complex [hydrothermal vent metagenome]|uniref:Dihydrolipoamide acetyltransferase component (E2) of acetoin dehydrogenase complex n=1 Tax=hydrothermal vent metagenome TaxID=652676 RepID=A0A3B0RQ06_9ZZZZ